MGSACDFSAGSGVCARWFRRVGTVHSWPLAVSLRPSATLSGSGSDSPRGIARKRSGSIGETGVRRARLATCGRAPSGFLLSMREPLDDSPGSNRSPVALPTRRVAWSWPGRVAVSIRSACVARYAELALGRGVDGIRPAIVVRVEQARELDKAASDVFSGRNRAGRFAGYAQHVGQNQEHRGMSR